MRAEKPCANRTRGRSLDAGVSTTKIVLAYSSAWVRVLRQSSPATTPATPPSGSVYSEYQACTLPWLPSRSSAGWPPPTSTPPILR